MTTLCSLLECLLITSGSVDLKLDAIVLHPLVCTVFVFCYIWSIGGNVIEAFWDPIDTFIRRQFEENSDAKVDFNVLFIRYL